MAAENEIPVDALRRRKRRAAILVGLISALFASGLFADWLFKDDRQPQTVWTSDTVFPRFAEHFLGRRGVTVPLGPTMIHDRQYKGEGGPEDPGPYIKEDDIRLAGRHDPIHVDGPSLPGRLFNRIGHLVPNNGVSFGGGGGGGPGGAIIACEKPSDAATLSEIQKICPGTPSKGDHPGTVVIDPTGSTANAPEPTGLPGTPGIGTSGTPQMPADEAVSPVPEPEGWVMMIAGFLLMGLAVRRHKARSGASRPT